MDEIIIKSDDLLVMNLINYFITEENYKPMIIHGINDEIWLENLDNNYKIVRIVSHHIHNKEQLDFDKFKLSKIVKQVKRKTLSFKVKVLSIYTDIEDEKILNNDDVLITKEKDINNPKLVSAFPDIVEKTNRKEDGLEYFIKVTDNINKKNEKRNKIAEKIFSYKQPIVTYIIMAICIILFILMELSGGSTNSQTLLKYGANLDVLVKNGEYYRLFTEFRENSNYEDWIIYILKGIEETSKNTIELIKLIQEEMEAYKQDFITKLPKIYSEELLDSLFYEVYTRINYIEERCHVTRQTAATYLNSLVEAGLLEFEKIGRESIYKNTRLINLLSSF